MSTKNPPKASIVNLTPESLDVEELERRLEMAAAAASCDCCGGNSTPCDSNGCSQIP